MIDGYKHFPNPFSSPTLDELDRVFLENKKVDYSKLTNIINSNLIPTLNSLTNWNASWIKYRISNNNNSTDASTFHRDLIPISEKKNELYTFLIYLDEATMQVVPGSHLKYSMELGESIENYISNVKTIKMSRGDILIFSSTLLHRGIFKENVVNRRLLQIFEVCPNMCSDSIAHIPATQNNNNIGKVMSWVSTVPIIIGILNFFSYLNASMGYGNVRTSSKYGFLSSEAGQYRASKYGIDDINKYILNDRVYDFAGETRWELFTRQYLAYLIFAILTIIIITFIFLKLFFRKLDRP